MTGRAPVIAIDGPGGSGKGTLAQRLARRLGWHFLDSGALYRLVALAADDADISLDDETRVARLAADLEVRFEAAGDASRIWLGGREVTSTVRKESAGEAASRVAALPAVREALTGLQRSFRQPPGLVADGRDMGTVIFPEAPLKVFLTASAEERARRRYKQLKAKGENVSISRLFREIEARDRRDQTRSVSPLKPAADAVVIDSTELGIEGVLRAVMDLLEEKGIIH